MQPSFKKMLLILIQGLSVLKGNSVFTKTHTRTSLGQTWFLAERGFLTVELELIIFYKTLHFQGCPTRQSITRLYFK